MSDVEGRFRIGGLEPGVFNLVLLEVADRKHAAAAAVEAVRVKAGAGDGRPGTDRGPAAPRGRHRPRR